MGAKEQAADPNARRYEIYRETARGLTAALIRLAASNGPAARRVLMPPEAAFASLSEIDDRALAAAAGWHFPWRRIVGQARPYFRRFELALWYRNDLYGLAVGRASRGPDNVTIHFLERASGNNPFAGYFAQIVVDSADRYAKLLGRQRVKLKNPVPGVVPIYRALGFSVAESSKGNTCR
jgi:hypothetical protein